MRYNIVLLVLIVINNIVNNRLYIVLITIIVSGDTKMKKSVSISASVYTTDLEKLGRICDEKQVNISEAVRWCISLAYARMLELGILRDPDLPANLTPKKDEKTEEELRDEERLRKEAEERMRRLEEAKAV